MATYTIIGGDGKEYGPVSGEDLRKWMAEGRLNAQTLAKAESDAEFRPLSAFPEFADAFAPQAPMPSAPPVFSTAASLGEGDYELDIGGCISRGWNLLKENFGTLFVACLIAFALQFAFMFALGLITAPVSKSLLQTPVAFQLGFKYLSTAVASLVVGPLFGGLYFVYLKTIRQQETGVGDVFAGFQRAFSQLFLGSLVVSLLIGLCMLPFNLVWQVKASSLLEQLQQGQHMAPADAQRIFPELAHAFVGALPVLLICLIPVTYLTVSWGFTLPLVIDRELKFWPAMKTSFKMVNKHWWQVFGLMILVGLISIAGVLGCCIGVLFTAPIGIAATMYAYETIFSRPQTG
jgi:hypothetical protein